MPLNQTELEFDLRQGVRSGLKWIIAPIMVIMFIVVVIVGVAFGVQYSQMPKGPPNVYNQEEMSATTDMYAESFFSAMSCVAANGAGGCDIDDKKSNMIMNITEEVVVLNEEKHAIPNKESLYKLAHSTELGKVDYMTLTTKQEGKITDKIKYSNSDHIVTLNFSNNKDGEVRLTSMQVEKIGE